MSRNHQFYFAEEAKFEIKESYRWYETRVPNLGEKFLYDLNNCLDRIDKNPKLYRLVYRNHRQGQLTNFPFVVIYEIIDSSIRVISVFHTSRNPKRKFEDG